VKAKAVKERDKYPEDVQHKETELFAAPTNGLDAVSNG
jgi:hypothetical protein